MHGEGRVKNLRFQKIFSTGVGTPDGLCTPDGMDCIKWIVTKPFYPLIKDYRYEPFKKGLVVMENNCFYMSEENLRYPKTIYRDMHRKKLIKNKVFPLYIQNGQK